MDERCRLYDTYAKKLYRDVKQFLLTLRDKPLDQVKKIHVMSYLSKAREGGAGDSTRNRKHAAVSSFFKALQEFELCSTNPAFGIKKQRPKRIVCPCTWMKMKFGHFYSRWKGNMPIATWLFFCSWYIWDYGWERFIL